MSTYSYWHFRTAKYPIERVIEGATRLGFDGVEILHRQMTDESPAYVNNLKQLASGTGWRCRRTLLIATFELAGAHGAAV